MSAGGPESLWSDHKPDGLGWGVKGRRENSVAFGNFVSKVISK